MISESGNTVISRSREFVLIDRTVAETQVGLAIDQECLRSPVLGRVNESVEPALLFGDNPVSHSQSQATTTGLPSVPQKSVTAISNRGRRGVQLGLEVLERAKIIPLGPHRLSRR